MFFPRLRTAIPVFAEQRAVNGPDFTIAARKIPASHGMPLAFYIEYQRAGEAGPSEIRAAPDRCPAMRNVMDEAAAGRRMAEMRGRG